MTSQMLLKKLEITKNIFVAGKDSVTQKNFQIILLVVFFRQKNQKNFTHFENCRHFCPIRAYKYPNFCTIFADVVLASVYTFSRGFNSRKSEEFANISPRKNLYIKINFLSLKGKSRNSYLDNMVCFNISYGKFSIIVTSQ